MFVVGFWYNNMWVCCDLCDESARYILLAKIWGQVFFVVLLLKNIYGITLLLACRWWCFIYTGMRFCTGPFTWVIVLSYWSSSLSLYDCSIGSLYTSFGTANNPRYGPGLLKKILYNWFSICVLILSVCNICLYSLKCPWQTTSKCGSPNDSYIILSICPQVICIQLMLLL